MRNRGTVVLLAGVVLAVGYAVYDYQSELKTEKTQSEKNRLVKFDKDQISEFSIHRVSSENLPAQDFTVERTSEGWKLKSPIQEVADQAASQDYVDGVVLELSHETVKEGAGIDWKIYGLDAPAGSASFKVNSGQTLQVDVSAKKNYSGDSYVRIQGEDKVYLAASTWLNKVQKRLFDFRDKRILKKAAATIHSFRYVHREHSFSIQKKEDLWISPDRPTWKLDQTKSNEFVYMLNTVSAIDITKESAPTPAEQKAESLNAPKFIIEAGFKEKETWKAAFASNAKQEHYVQTFDPPRVLRISSPDMDKFSHLELENFRDRHEAFDFDKTHVRHMHVMNGALSADFTLKNDEWTLDKNDPALEYQAERPKSILALVRNLEAMDFEPQTQIPGPDLNQEVRLSDEKDQVVYEIKFLKTYRKTIKGFTKAFVLVKTSTSPNLLGVDEGTFRTMGLDALVNKKASAQ